MLVFYRILAYKKYVLELTPVQITRHVDKTDIFQVCFGRRCAGAVEVSRDYGE